MKIEYVGTSGEVTIFEKGSVYDCTVTGIVPLHVQVHVDDKKMMFGHLSPDRSHVFVYGKGLHKFEVIEE